MKTHFASGREIPEIHNYIGIDPDGGVAFGYDASAIMPDATWEGAQDSDKYLSAEDCVELADMMIERWTALKAKYALNPFPQNHQVMPSRGASS